MISPEDVRAAYRLLLNREAESSHILQEHATRLRDLRSLRDHFLDSSECEATRVPKIPGILDQGPWIRVDVDVDDHVLQKMFDRVERTWHALGKDEPHWSVLTDDRFKKKEFIANAADFYGSGKNEVERFYKWLERNEIDGSGWKSCREYGCGTGRITPWLAERFSHVNACDISEPHLAAAEAVTLQKGFNNVAFTRVCSPRAVYALDKVDVAFSIIVLQHNPPPVIAFLLGSLLRALNPGGVAFLQVPTYRPAYSFDAGRYLSSRRDGAMEMHLLPQRYIFSIAERENCNMIEMLPDGYVGSPQFLSHTCLFQKRAM